MSKVAIQGNASGTGTFTIQSPATNTDRVLSLPDEAGTVLTSASTFGVSQLPSQLSVNASASSGSLAIDSAGRVTMPYQPSFHAQWATGGYQFGNGTVVWDTTNHNIGNHYSTSTGLFTAPVSGVYYFGLQVQHNGVNSSNGFMDILVNGGQINARYEHTSGASYQAAGISLVVSLSSGDNVKASGSGDIFWADNSAFMGYLIG